MCDIEKLIDNTFPIVESLLKRGGSFPMQASAIKPDGLFTRIGAYNGAERISTAELITQLKKALRKKRSCYRSVAIFTDIRIVDPATDTYIRAIEVYIEAMYEMSAYIFYYPYSLPGKKDVQFGNAWSQVTRKEIFSESDTNPRVPVFIEKPELPDDEITGRARISSLKKFWGHKARQAKQSKS